MLTSDAITLISQLDTIAAGSRLFSRPLASPRGGSTFDPLPPDLLSRAGPNATANGVQTQFMALAFSPYPAVSASAGAGASESGIGGQVTLAQSVTRLKFSTGDGGSEISVGNRTSPIRFTMPAPSDIPAGSGALCQFWDEQAAAFSGEGCAALPIRPPRGHVVSWTAAEQLVAPPAPAAPVISGRSRAVVSCTAVPDSQAVTFFNASGPAAAARQLAVSWQIAGPAVCGCSATVLDCAVENARAVRAAEAARQAGAGDGGAEAAAAAARRKVYLSPRDAILIPAVSCPPKTNAHMLVFYGAAPAARRAFRVVLFGAACFSKESLDS